MLFLCVMDCDGWVCCVEEIGLIGMLFVNVVRVFRTIRMNGEGGSTQYDEQ